MATTGNLSMYVGEDKDFIDSILTAAGGPQDVSGWTAVMHVTAPGDSGTEYFQVAGVLSSPTTDGEITFTVPAALTEDMPAGCYSYCIERTNAGAQAVPTIGLLTLLPGGTFGI